MPRVRRQGWQSSIDIRYSITLLYVQRLTGWSSTSQPLSRHILLIDILNLCSLFTVYISTPIFTVGLQYQATWRALCLGLRIRHVSRGEGGSFVPQNPLILRDRVPSFWGWLPPVLRPVCLRFSRSAYLRFLLRPERLQCFWGQSCLRCVFKAHVPSVFEVFMPPLRVFLLATQRAY